MSANVKHILRYGTNAEKEIIDNLSSLFDLLALNGNMLAYTPNVIARFIMMHFLDTENHNKGFFIDPITHAFQHEIDKIKSYSQKKKKFTIKKSIEKLLNYYGEPVKSIIGNDKVVLPSNFNEKNKKKFCANVIKFQINTITEELEKSGFMEYLEYIPENNIDKIKPLFVIPPYFYITQSTFDDWFPINLDFIKIAQNEFKNKIFAQLVISKDILHSKCLRERLLDGYINSKPNGILLWIDSFNEHYATVYELTSYVNLIKSFSENNIEIYNLYGGFFSIILTGFIKELGFNLNGVGHGLEYGEYRSVVPVGGGIPTSKYYYYPLHNRLDYKSASEFLKSQGYFNLKPLDGAKKYYKEICDCKTCKDEVIKNDINNFYKFENTEFYEVKIKNTLQRRSYPSKKTKKICISHYLYSKYFEFSEVKNKSLANLINDLENSYDKYASLGVLGLENLAYLRNWVKVLKEI